VKFKATGWFLNTSGKKISLHSILRKYCGENIFRYYSKVPASL